MSKYVSGLTHKAYHVTNMEQTLRFYCECLGLQKIFEIKNDEGENWLVYLKISDRQFIELFYGGKSKREIKWPDFSSPKTEWGFSPQEDEKLRHEVAVHICFEVEDIHATVKRLEEFGYPIVMPIGYGKDFNYETFIQDPDGNLIELMQYTDKALQFKETANYGEQ